MRQRRLGFLTLFLLLAVALFWSQYRPRTRHLPFTNQAALAIPEERHQSYSTTFPAGENPLSEKGKWLDGKAVGLDWSSVAALNGLAYGTEAGTGKGARSYDDSTALLTGTWGADQTVEARVYSLNQTDAVLEEVELRLRSSLSPHISTGYEILFRCLRTPNAYASIVRWDGPLGRFTYLAQKYGLRYGIGDGDLIKATIVGNIITGYINGVQVLTAADSTFSRGNPGIGFWIQKHSGLRAWFTNIRVNNTDYGLRSFAAWD